MIKLEQLHGDKGARQKRKRVGRGESSGWGKTAGKGHKGAQARTGTPKGKSFEGGQTPMTRRLPKRGFNRTNWQTPVRIVNLEQLNRFEDGVTVDFEALTAAGLVSSKDPCVKILGKGALQKKNLTVSADMFSKTAREQIEASGGKCLGRDMQELPAPPEPVMPAGAPAAETVEAVEAAAPVQETEEAVPAPKKRAAKKAAPAEDASEQQAAVKKAPAKKAEQKKPAEKAEAGEAE